MSTGLDFDWQDTKPATFSARIICVPWSAYLLNENTTEAMTDEESFSVL